MRCAVVVVLVALALASCSEDEVGGHAVQSGTTTAATTSTAPGSTTTTITSADEAAAATTAPSSTTTVPGAAPIDDENSMIGAQPWHDEGRGADDAASALEEFLVFFGFDDRVDLVGLPPGDASDGQVEIRPWFEGAPVDADAPPADLWSPTSVTLERTSGDRWVVTGATSPAVVVDTPFDGQQVASPLDVRATNQLAGDPLVLAVWSGSTRVVERFDVDAGAGVLAQGTFDLVLRWPDDLRGPAVLIVQSRSPAGGPAVTTVSIDLADTTAPDDRPQPPTALGPVGEQRVDIEYQRGVRLTLHEPGPCNGVPRPVVATGGPQDFTFVDEFTERGYVVADVAWRTPGYTAPALDAGSLRAVSFAVNDLAVAVQWLRAHADELCLDANRIVAMGYSFGGITALSLAYSQGELEPGDVVAVEPLGPETELRDPPSGPPPGLDVYPNEPSVVVSFGGFALADTVEAGEPPAMLIHGRNDPVVPFALAEQTCAAAIAAGVVCEVVPHDDGHSIPGSTFDDVGAFISRVLDSTP